MSRPTLKQRRDLNRNDGHSYFEVWSPALKRGCMLCIRDVPLGGVEAGNRLVIEVYSGDDGVFVRQHGRDYKVPK